MYFLFYTFLFLSISDSQYHHIHSIITLAVRYCPLRRYEMTLLSLLAFRLTRHLCAFLFCCGRRFNSGRNCLQVTPGFDMFVFSCCNPNIFTCCISQMIMGFAKLKTFQKSIKKNLNRAHPTHPPPSKLFFLESHH